MAAQDTFNRIIHKLQTLHDEAETRHDETGEYWDYQVVEETESLISWLLNLKRALGAEPNSDLT